MKYSSVNIETLGQSVAVEINVHDIESDRNDNYRKSVTVHLKKGDFKIIEAES